jgi:hypothetical protein
MKKLRASRRLKFVVGKLEEWADGAGDGGTLLTSHP